MARTRMVMVAKIFFPNRSNMLSIVIIRNIYLNRIQDMLIQFNLYFKKIHQDGLILHYLCRIQSPCNKFIIQLGLLSNYRFTHI
jgi:hypothetical protein